MAFNSNTAAGTVVHTTGEFFSGTVLTNDQTLVSVTDYASISEANALAWAKAKIGSDEVSALENVVTKRVEEKNISGVTTGKTW